MSRPPKFAVTVATRNRGVKIVPLLESLLRSDVPDFEVVIIDQSTNDATRRAVEPFLADRRFRYILTEIAGTSRARNQGIALTSAPIVAITDDDCIVPSSWLRLLTKPFAEDPRVGVVYCSVVPARIHKSGHTPQIRFRTNQLLKGNKTPWRGNDLWMGAGMAIRRSMLVEVQGFDEGLGPGARFPACEDNDIAWRALERGWWVFENADVCVVHDGHRSPEDTKKLMTRDFLGIGGTLAKYIKTGHFRTGIQVVPLFFRFAIVEPSLDILKRHTLPRGMRRATALVRGLIRGLCTPVDSASLCYRRSSASLVTADDLAAEPSARKTGVGS